MQGLRTKRSLKTVIAIAFSVLSVTLAQSGAAQTAQKVRVDIPAQDLSAALTQFGRETGTEIVFAPDAVREKKAVAVKGEFDRNQALQLILEGSGLTYRVTTQGAIVVESLKSGSADASQATGFRLSQTESDSMKKVENTGSQKSGSSADESESSSSVKVEEIVVTAQKREERLQDVPLAVTAISASTLVNSDYSRLQDYFTSVPGLSLTTASSGEAMVSIRGIRAESDSSTVGILVDGTPIALSAGEGSFTAPDIDPSTLRRVEVLRGPQGTLYGASGMGGLINYVTVEPSMDSVNGRVSVGSTTVAHGDDLGYSVRGSVNVPLNDQLAIRVSGFTRADPGYIDRFYFAEPGAKEADVNGSDAYGGHLTLLWRPSDAFSLRLSALAQRFNSDGISESIVDPSFADLEQVSLRGTGTTTRESQVYSATLRAKLGDGELTSISAFSTNPFKSIYDVSGNFGFLGPLLFPGTNAIGLPVSNIQNTMDKFTQEVRYSAPLGKRLEYMLAAFYTREKWSIFAPASMIDPITRESPGLFFIQDERNDLEEYAVFGNLTFHLSEQLDIQVGGRQSRYRREVSQYLGGVVYCPELPGDPACEPYAAGDSAVFVQTLFPSIKNSAFTYLLTPRFKVSPDLMVYARLATGYRVGLPNVQFPNTPVQAPKQTDPDTTKSYEAGAKGNLFAGKLSFDASIYYTDWEEIPLGVSTGLIAGYTDNAGQAVSKGLELALESRPVSGLTLEGWLAWNDAKMTEVSPDTTVPVVSGDRLPFSSRFTGYFSAEQQFPVGDRMSAFLGASVTYAGRRVAGFFSGVGREVYPAYTQTNARAGVRYDDWTVRLFINNIADKRAAVDGGIGSGLGDNYFTFIRPRTMGLSLERSF